jgi:hypothetical protein
LTILTDPDSRAMPAHTKAGVGYFKAKRDPSSTAC